MHKEVYRELTSQFSACSYCDGITGVPAAIGNHTGLAFQNQSGQMKWDLYGLKRASGPDPILKPLSHEGPRSFRTFPDFLGYSLLKPRMRIASVWSRQPLKSRSQHDLNRKTARALHSRPGNLSSLWTMRPVAGPRVPP